ncbi:MAG: hypothetical protein V7707_03210 [Motiliproteus sp.]
MPSRSSVFNQPLHMLLATTLCAGISSYSLAAKTTTSATIPTADEQPESPWLATPTISSDPKSGSSVGALGAYIHNFDKVSPASMFGVVGSYSNTDSYKYGAFARTYFDADDQRLMAMAFKGKIINDYQDFLGIGLPLQSTDSIEVIALRYQHRLEGHWYLGPQLVSTHYDIAGGDSESQEILDELGLEGFDSNGLGIALAYDSRDNQNSASSGVALDLNNVAYRKSFGGDVSFDAYTGKVSTYRQHGNGHVLAMRTEGRWTNDAPNSGYSSVSLRGYSRGQFLAPHMTMVEAEERYKLADKWTWNAFGGLACLYGNGLSCSSSDNLYPSIGSGISYTVKPEQKMVIRADIAIGKGESQGFYLQFGQPF